MSIESSALKPYNNAMRRSPFKGVGGKGGCKVCFITQACLVIAFSRPSDMDACLFQAWVLAVFQACRHTLLAFPSLALMMSMDFSRPCAGRFQACPHAGLFKPACANMQGGHFRPVVGGSRPDTVWVLAFSSLGVPMAFSGLARPFSGRSSPAKNRNPF